MMPEKSYPNLLACIAGLAVVFSAAIASQPDLADQYRGIANQLIDAAPARPYLR